ncbi:exosomal polycystin-1-interacting protein [Carettochelys insculpta]|uniref:exosomal polycystin-1-interacting protein n=1 Tax=Carettochelys insculpta TaxID=44489 RepID=UPI003EB92ACF
MLGNVVPGPCHKHYFLLVGFLGFCLNSSARSQKNKTLIFTKENTIRNCSCSAEIHDCDYSLANLMCSCKTILPYTIDRGSYHSDLTVWFTDTAVLGMLLNFTVVHYLKLSLCGTTPLPKEYLAILGLKKLRINSEVKGQFLEQNLTIYNSGDNEMRDKLKVLRKDKQMFLYISVLDTSLFNRFSLLKSYSVENVSSITDRFPSLPYSEMFSTTSNKSYVVTFIY